ncbi:hypothetical protein [Amycolatopsis keratiniphila]|uniref:hypothetical protein n=1 Tax=Amycolatopsis keratiniphila TaxID=129921 RepID=UPI000879741E|nr:hypothetical protein [Amycolatopsis keratiniphila]OLZ43666.1 hypothetical protein BS330_42435 [Amycolatopsis keratiniphila subsp. nogabecina]SDU10227.1 hypothetical protein SAMN04489733_1146 [Amycolatopsis keratiniphila]
MRVSALAVFRASSSLGTRCAEGGLLLVLQIRESLAAPQIGVRDGRVGLGLKPVEKPVKMIGKLANCR